MKWDIVYEEKINDSWGPNYTGVISNGEKYVFYHALCDAEDDEPICHIYETLQDFMQQKNELVSYKWTAENDSLFLAAMEAGEDVRKVQYEE